ncbi:hypothetical protein [Aliikangiella coralliicola]|uniref:4-vinyl reductase 4VR domain-containing protein n=1 Tax=Aliikangiella coralliicola TaxID=2592383 RepID=A0A545UJG5_9GAMM|nr:hypothetical protein [Aliikangiella coralliicola]TQV89599.1 hypothetical protein FLL46_01575 [Aliikangiella coralliicola]
MLYVIVKEQPGLLVKIYRCLNQADYRITSHHLNHNPKEGKVSVKLVIAEGDLPIPFSLESQLLNIDGCLDIMYEEPNWEISNADGDNKISDEVDKKIKSTALAIVNDFGNVENFVQGFRRKFDESAASLQVYRLGVEVGAAIYQNDYSLGKPLEIEKALKRMLSNAIKKFGKVSCSKRTLTIENNIFCNLRNPDSECDFTKGFITGFLKNSPKTNKVKIQNYSCRSHGQVACSFEFH